MPCVPEGRGELRNHPGPATTAAPSRTLATPPKERDGAGRADGSFAAAIVVLGVTAATVPPRAALRGETLEE
ncbi:hypothetical protein [Streptomyces sp. NBC_00996]|uniref:hypothetical protein n=1 Tax=Streptomyces sp. NBC_00996 TaxID=2903710 RepID=UPI00386AA195|nr:hypothetical protein OG390_18010 [Streptomyces sp. NBC_00996]